MASNDVDYAGVKGSKPPLTKCQKIRRGIYNPDKKEILGRTCASWAKIGVFYLVFYSCLAGFFAIMLMGFFATLDEKEPTMTGMYSLIKGNPGMSFRPLAKEESSLMTYNASDDESVNKTVQSLLNYLIDGGYINKNYSMSTEKFDANGNETFDFDLTKGECRIDPDNPSKSFGFADGTPCVLLKINKTCVAKPACCCLRKIISDLERWYTSIMSLFLSLKPFQHQWTYAHSVIGWKPEAYDLDNLPTDKEINNTKPGDNIAVTCIGEDDGDAQNLGEVKIFPQEGMAFKYFPYQKIDGYRSPFVFAKFMNVKKGVIIQVWCKMWAKNIKIHKNDKAGSIRFELMVDKNEP